jgi:NADH-quinone oxidoreductase subunit F
MLRYAIPDYRLPTDILHREIGNITSLGIHILRDTSIDTPGKLKKIEKEFDAVFIAAGAQKDISLKIKGEHLSGVFSSIDLLGHISPKKKLPIGKQVVVIGGGNAAIDAARSIIRLGSRAHIVYRREECDMPAMEDEIREAYNEGVQFTFLAGPAEILGNGNGKVKGIDVAEMRPGDYDSSGRRRPVPTGNRYTIECDAVVLAIGEKPESAFLSKYGIKVKTSGFIPADDHTLQTNNKKFYAGGDIVTGPATVTQAMAAGKKFAWVIDSNLMQEDRMGLIIKNIPCSQEAPPVPLGGGRQKMRQLPVKKRLETFDEVDRGLTGKAAESEALRCLRCDVKEM